VRLREDGTIAEIVEKSEHPPTDLAAIGLMVLSGEVFHYEPRYGIKTANTTSLPW
jgi:dTDP-glucose pyrophosphorylase